jgi:hypothetical protein
MRSLGDFGSNVFAEQSGGNKAAMAPAGFGVSPCRRPRPESSERLKDACGNGNTGREFKTEGQ